MLIHRRTLLLLTLCLGISVYSAGVFAEEIAWEFGDKSGTRLNRVVDSNGRAGGWSEAFERSRVTGRGVYRLGRGSGSVSNSYRRLRFANAEQVTAVYELSGWKIEGPTANETLRLGLVHTTHAERPRVLCQFNLRRTDKAELTLSLEAFGEGSSNEYETVKLPATSDAALRLKLVYDAASNRYEGHYAVGDGAFKRLGGGSTSPEREPNHLRLGATGSFDSGDGSEHVAFDRIAVSGR
ncbi:MAG: hypothetical protein AAF797_00580 [Planctomycetota bacterium]